MMFYELGLIERIAQEAMAKFSIEKVSCRCLFGLPLFEDSKLTTPASGHCNAYQEDRTSPYLRIPNRITDSIIVR